MTSLIKLCTLWQKLPKKFEMLDLMICSTRMKTDVNRFTECGITFKFKDASCQQALFDCLQDLNLLLKDKEDYCITYEAIWKSTCSSTEIATRKKKLEARLA